MIAFAYTVANPRTMVVIFLHKNHFNTTVTIWTMTSFWRFPSFTKWANKLSLISLIQKNHSFLSSKMDKAWVAMTDHHKCNCAEQKYYQRSNSKLNIQMWYYKN